MTKAGAGAVIASGIAPSAASPAPRAPRQLPEQRGPTTLAIVRLRWPGTAWRTAVASTALAIGSVLVPYAAGAQPGNETWNISGTWSGSYACAQNLSVAQLDISDTQLPNGPDELSATFNFETPGFERGTGSFTMSGTFSGTNPGSVQLSPTSGVVGPAASVPFIALPLSGQLSGNQITGSIEGAGCGGITLNGTAQMRPVPARLAPGSEEVTPSQDELSRDSVESWLQSAPSKEADSCADASYYATVLDEPITLYRRYGTPPSLARRYAGLESTKLGSDWSYWGNKAYGPSAARRLWALPPWNDASNLVTIEVPKGTLMYYCDAAPKTVWQVSVDGKTYTWPGKTVSGGSLQVMIPGGVKPGWVRPNT